MAALRSFRQACQTSHAQYYVWLLLITLACFWPLSMSVYSVKNDAIHYFLPYRFHISEALRHGELPLWSPYIYLGYPIHGDMQSGAWNPVTWIFSMIGRYDLTLFHYENLLYIFLGGAGMYRLSWQLSQEQRSSFLVACSYMLSGFMLGGQLINWLAAAAFIPFCFSFYLHTLESRKLLPAIYTSVFLFLLFTAGYPSFFILILYLFAGLLLVRLWKMKKAREVNAAWVRLAGIHLLMVIFFFGLSLPAFLSYLDLFPYYQRGSGTSFWEAVRNSFSLKHLSTFFFPSTIKSSGFESGTDVTCRNIYTGILVLPIIVALPPKRSLRTWLLAGLFIFSLLFSLGEQGVFRKLTYLFVPLMDTFRHPSQMRLFMILALLLLALPGLTRLIRNEINDEERKRLNITTWILLVAMLLCITVAALNGISSPSRSLASGWFSDLLTADAVFYNGFIQVITVAAFLLWLRYFKSRLWIFSLTWILNLVLFAQWVMPVTVIGRTPAHVVNNFIRASPAGFAIMNPDQPIGPSNADALQGFDQYSLTYFYNKKIGISKVTNSPAFLDQQEAFIKSRLLYDYVAARPPLYLADTLLSETDSLSLEKLSCNGALGSKNFGSGCSDSSSVKILRLAANRWLINMTVTDEKYLVLDQNYHHNWMAILNEYRTRIERVNLSFIGVRIPRGRHVLELVYEPPYIFWSMCIQFLTIITIMICSIWLAMRAVKKRIKPIN